MALVNFSKNYSPYHIKLPFQTVFATHTFKSNTHKKTKTIQETEVLKLRTI